MKKYTVWLMILAMTVCLAGCRANVPEETQPSTQPTQTAGTTQATEPETTAGNQNANDAAGILGAVWAKYGEADRFAVYGGMMDAPVDNAPGNLNLSNADEITSKYLIPAEQLAQMEEGASLVHLMNSNLFTAAVFRLKADADMEAAAKAIRENIQRNQWICGQPDELLIARPEGNYLLVAFGSEDAMGMFSARFAETFADAKSFYDEAIVA